MPVLLVFVVTMPVAPATPVVVIIIVVVTLRVHCTRRVAVMASSLCLRCIGCSKEEHYQK